SDRGLGTRAPHIGARTPGSRAAARRLRRPGASALPPLPSRRDVEGLREAERHVGPGACTAATRAAAHPARPTHRDALRRTAGAGRAHARAREASGIALARRAGGVAGSARTA